MAAFLLITFLGISGISPLSAANPNGDLRLEIISAYNLVVDSNVESPSTYAPRAFHAGVKVCNDGTNALTDVYASIGNYINGTSDTPGVYPARTHAGLVGTFSLTHQGGSAGARDAVRYIGNIAGGQCITQYWLLSYPRLDANGKSVTLGIKPDDDLWLEYDIWATANDAGVNLLADQTRKVTMRNEISAMANKIWPNTSSKVPNEFLAVVNQLGWGNPDVVAGSEGIYPGQTTVIEGIWYDLGNVRHGFDNDGDLLPDYNVWMQPVGDPAAYDAGCFRLVRTDALLVVKLNNGTFDTRTVTDQLYFANLPENNTGAVGLVYYTFAALNGVCSATLTPYQEVASGFDNEKFNGDYGASIAPLKSKPPAVSFNKAVNRTVITPSLPATLAFTMTFTNTGPVNIGDPALGIPFVIQDRVPTGTLYVSGTAALNNTLPVAYTILYSTNSGVSWTRIPPPAASVTDIQWWLDAPLAPGAGGSATFQVTVPTTYTQPLVLNTGGASYGSAAPFIQSTTTTLVPGPNSIGSLVWADNGGTSGLAGNGAQEGGETGIANMTVSLYFDANGNGTLEATDTLLQTRLTNGTGNYLFSGLPDGRYIVAVSSADPTLTGSYPGWGNTTPLRQAVSLDPNSTTTAAVNVLDKNFGFAPVLSIQKKVISSTPLYEGYPVTYTIDLKSNLPGNGTGTPLNCQYTVWARQEDTGHSGTSTKIWGDIPNAFGSAEPNKLYASADFLQGSNKLLAGTGFTLGNDGAAITKVELLFPVYVSQPLADDFAIGYLWFDDVQLGSTQAFTTGQINQYVGAANVGTMAWDVTARRAWTWADFTPNRIDVAMEGQKNASPDSSVLYLDGFGLRVTSSRVCDQPGLTLSPLPLTDTYDPNRLQFVSSVPAVSSSSPAGTLNWNDLGPLYAGGTRQVTVTFKALEPAGNVTQTITNTAAVTQATFVNGLPANSASSFVTSTLAPTGSITGVVWSDLNANGWPVGTIGKETTEPGIPGVTMTLTSCSVPFSGGSCSGTTSTMTAVTDQNGLYRFDGLFQGLYYRVVATSPGGTQTGDPEDDNNSSTGTTGDYGLCGGTSPSAPCDNTWLDAGNGTNGFRMGVETWGGNSWDVKNINFGYAGAPATIHGNIWNDVNRNGVQNTADNPLANVTVYLCLTSPCTSANAVQTTKTNAAGNYSFRVSSAGLYYIGVAANLAPLGSGWSQTVDPGESGVCTTCDSTHSVTVVLGQVYGSYNFAYGKTGTGQIGDMIFYDWNGNGVQDAIDEGIPGRTVELYEDFNNDGVIDANVDPLISTTVTALNGSYLFTQVPAGNYLVRTSTPTGTLQTKDPDQGGTCTLCDNRGVVSAFPSTGITLTVDFGYKPFGTGQIGDAVWFDQNGDGVQSGVLETGLISITVSLLADMNGDGVYVPITSTVTSSTGGYLFSNLPDGRYRVVVDTTDTDLPNDLYGNRYVPTTPITHTVVMSGGVVSTLNGTGCTGCDLKSDFGFTNLGALGDTIYWDANNNGTQDWNEVGIAGVTITLTNSSTITMPNGTVWPPGTYVTTTVTSSGGSTPIGTYRFTGLPAGGYTVTVSTSGPIGGAAQTADPDRDGENCISTLYPSLPACDNGANRTLALGSSFMGLDFGYLPAGTIGDFVWFDQNGDGLQSGTELGISGLVVTVTNGASTVTTTTDLDGRYTFQGLGAGTWTVTVQQPAGMTPSSSGNISDLLNGNGSVGSTSGTVTIDGTGAVTALNGSSCTGCPLNLDFGFKYSGLYALNGSVCLEESLTTANIGGCDVGDTKVMSQTVFLYNSAGQLIGQTMTSASGTYTFTNLVTDTYRVVVGTSTAMLSNTQLKTNVGNSPANSGNPGTPLSAVTLNPGSVFQTVLVNGTTAGGDSAVTTVDFAFESTLTYDYGDLPQSYNTLLEGSPSGPRHVTSLTPSLYLGSAPDSEVNGAPGVLADGDGADEDGVTLAGGWDEGANGGPLSIVVNGSGWLVGWIDFNMDGDFYDSGEMVISQAVTTGTLPISVDVPAGTFSGGAVSLYSRFRLFPSQPSFPEVSFTGSSTGGEVEDYIFNFSPTQVSLLTVSTNRPAGGAAWLWLLLAVTLIQISLVLLGGRARRWRRKG